MIEYNINYWLIGTGLGLYIAPFIVFGYKIFISIFDYNIYQLNINSTNKYNDISKIYNGSNYNDTNIFLIKDINNIFSIYRGINRRNSYHK